MLRWRLIGAVSFGAMAAASPGAYAQTAPDAPAVESADAAGPNEGIQDIVVTAQRRSERLQSVPLAISAVTSQQLQNAGTTGTQSIAASVPAVVFVPRGNSAQPFIRGIGTLIGAANGEASVPTYVDDVYQPANNANFFAFNDVERVEVLKGPQGTLFGRNSTGGVLHIITRDPGDRFEGQISAGYGNYNTASGSLSLSGPIANSLSASLSAIYSDQKDGWGRNLTTGHELYGDREAGVRGKLLFTPDEATHIRLALDYYRSKTGNGNPQNPAGYSNFGGNGYAGKFNVWGDKDQVLDNESWGASLLVDHDFGGVSLKSISAYRKTTGKWFFDLDLSPVPILDINAFQFGEMYSQEVHLTSASDSKIKWLVGAYYFDYNAGFDPNDQYGIGARWFNSTHARSYSIFGNVTYPITDRTAVTLGARYTWEKTKGTMIGYFAGVFTGETHPQTDDNFATYRLALDHHFSTDVMVYASASKGVKSGGINIAALAPSPANAPYAHELLKSYEVGFKTEFAGRRVRFNGSAFHYDFTNMQYQIVINNAATVLNATKATSEGVELELEARPVPRLTITANGIWMHTKFGDFPGALQTLPVLGSVPTSGTFNAKGNRLPNSPKFAGTAGFAYEIPSSIGNFRVNGTVYYNSGYPYEIDNLRNSGSYTLVNAGIEWRDRSDKFSVAVTGQNLFNKYYYGEWQGIGGVVEYAQPAAPRTYGVKFAYQF